MQMAFRIFSRFNVLNSCSTRLQSEHRSLRGALRVEHDREKLRFTVTLGGAAGKQTNCAVLQYKFINEKQVDLISTNVPENFRGKGVAALLSKAAMDFLAAEDLKAHISCWYIKKYIEDNPTKGYEGHIAD